MAYHVYLKEPKPDGKKGFLHTYWGGPFHSLKQAEDYRNQDSLLNAGMTEYVITKDDAKVRHLVKIGFDIDEDILEHLKLIATNKHIAVERLMCDILQEYVENYSYELNAPVD